MTGCPPGCRITLRELAWRVDAVLTQRWQEIAWLSAAVFNAQPGRKRPMKPQHCNPYRGLWPSAGHEDHDLDNILGIED